MSTDLPASSQEPHNPYAPPLAEVGGQYADLAVLDSEVEAIRRFHLGHEATVLSIGSLHYVGVFFGVLILCGLIAALSMRMGGEFVEMGVLGIVVYGVMTGVNFALGYGLRRLQPWARWTEAVFLGLGALSTLIGIAAYIFVGAYGIAIGSSLVLLLYSYLLWVLLSAKGSMVFSPAYKLVIEKTPHIKYKTSLILKVALAVFFAVIVLAVIGAITSS